MKHQQTLLLVSVAAGALAVAAGLAGLNRLAASAAAVMLVLFLLAPWMRERDSSESPLPERQDG